MAESMTGVAIARCLHTAAVTIGINWRQVSREERSFPEEMSKHQEKITTFEGLLRELSFPKDHEVWKILKDVQDTIKRGKDHFDELKSSSCCWRWFNIAYSPESWTDIAKDVKKACDDINSYLEGKQQTQRLLEMEATGFRTQLSFSHDENYVPITKTVKKIQEALEDDDSGNNVVLLFGGLGCGKSSLAKYMALYYDGRSRNVASPSNNSKFSGGVFFYSCGKSENSVSLIRRFWKDLGYQLNSPLVTDYKEEVLSRDAIIAGFRKELKYKLEKGKRVLIILDDVEQPKLIEDLLIAVGGVKYLVTSHQKIWSDRVKYVLLEPPSLLEGRDILANHIPGWGRKTFPKEVEREVDKLIEEADFHPVLLTKLATSFTGDSEVSSFQRWTETRKCLLNIVRNQGDGWKPMMYKKIYKGDLTSSFTIVIDLLRGNDVRGLLYVLAIGGADGVDENVLRFLFYRLHGSSRLNYEGAFEDLLQKCFMSVHTTEVIWKGVPLKICSIPKVRRILFREKNATEVNETLQMLIGMERDQETAAAVNDIDQKRSRRERDEEDGGSEKDLIAALVLVYSDLKYNEEAKRRIQSQVHVDLLPEGSMPERKEEVRRPRLNFMKAFARMLLPDFENAEDWEKKTHKHAKSVIFRFLRFLKLEDRAIRTLLEIPNAFQLSCSALQKIPPGFGACSIPTTIRWLVDELKKKCVDTRPFPASFKDLRLLLDSLHQIQLRSTFDIKFILREEPQILQCFTSLLEYLKAGFGEGFTLLHSSTMSLLDCFSLFRETRIIVAKNDETMKNFLSLLREYSIHVKVHSRQELLESSAKVFLELACRDPDVKGRTIDLPHVLETLVNLLSVTPKPALQALEELAWKSVDAERIASCPGVLNELAKLLSDYSDVQSNAIRCLGQIASFRTGRIIIASKCPSALRTLIELLHVDSPPDLFDYIAMAVRKIVSEEIDFFLESSRSFLTEVLQRLNLLFSDNVRMSVRGRAVHALEILASEEAICKRLDAHSGLLEQIIKIPPHPEVEYLTHVNSAVKRIFMEGKGLEEARRKNLVILSVQMYRDLLQSRQVGSEITQMVAKGLGNISCRQEFRKVVTDTGAENIIVKQMKIDPTFYKSEAGAHVVEDILFGGTNLSQWQPERKVLVGKVLDFYMRSLRDDFRIQENSIRTIASLAYWEEIRKVLIEGRRIEKLLDHVRSSPSAVSLECVAKIIYRVCCMEWDEVQRSIILEMTLERYAAFLGDGMKSDVEEAATVGMAILTSRKEARTMILEDEKKIDLLLGRLDKHATRKTLNLVVYLVQNTLVEGTAKMDTAVDTAAEHLFELRGDGMQIMVQAGAVEALGRLAFRQGIGQCRVPDLDVGNKLIQSLTMVELKAMMKEVCEVLEFARGSQACVDGKHDEFYRKALKFYVTLLDDANEHQHGEAALCLAKLLCYEKNRELCKSICPCSKYFLNRIVEREYRPASEFAAMALSLLEPSGAEKDENFSCVSAMVGGGWALVHLKEYKRALKLYDRAMELAPRESSLLCTRGFVKAQLRDVAGALEDLNQAASIDKKSSSLILQARGILKSMKGDYSGALLDLNESLRIAPETYEVLNLRGYVKLQLKDYEGANFDAQQANSLRFTMAKYTVHIPSSWWATLDVKYLEY